MDHKLNGFLRGIALGDSLGLVAEGLTRRQVALMYRDGIDQTYFFRKGFISDDTEHALLTLYAVRDVITGKAETLQQSMRRQLVRWFLTLSPGMGVTTLKSCLRLLMRRNVNNRQGSPISTNSAGNGPLVRAAVLGALTPKVQPDFINAILQTTGLTHSAPQALVTSTVMASVFSYFASLQDRGDLTWQGLEMSIKYALHAPTRTWNAIPGGSEAVVELEGYLATVKRQVTDEISFDQAMKDLGCADGVDAYIVRSAMASILIAWNHRGDMNRAIDVAIRAGGDTDSTASLVGGLLGLLAQEDEFSRLRLWSALPTLDESGIQRLRSVGMGRMFVEHVAMLVAFAPHLVRRTVVRLMR
jgi:ADP-ribosyl-[dinitrogen reductase] hydrolase